MIRTNALANLGFSIVDGEGCIVTSEENAIEKHGIVETPIQATEPQDNNATMQETLENGDSKFTYKRCLSGKSSLFDSWTVK